MIKVEIYPEDREFTQEEIARISDIIKYAIEDQLFTGTFVQVWEG